MKYLVTGLVLAGLAGCAWFGGDDDEDRHSRRVDDDRTKVGYSSQDLDGQGGAPQGALDPVSGEWVPQDTAYKAQYEGMTYYFTSKDNMEAFQRRPSDFVTADGYLRKNLDDVRKGAEVK